MSLDISPHPTVVRRYILRRHKQRCSYSHGARFTFQNHSFHWKDGRPVVYPGWTNNYLKNVGPSEIRVGNSTGSFVNHSLQALLSNVSGHVQPHNSDVNNCTALLGTPGPETMDFVSVPCDLKLDISGVVCSSGAREPPQSYDSVTYELHHWLAPTPSKLSNLLEDVSDQLKFNIDRFSYDVLQTSLYKGVHMDYFNISFSDIYTQTDIDTKYLSFMIWPWKSFSQQCRNRPWSKNGTFLFDCMYFALSLNNTSIFQHLHKTISVNKRIVKNPSRSVELLTKKLHSRFHGDLHCVLVHSLCMRPVQVKGKVNVESINSYCSNVVIPTSTNKTNALLDTAASLLNRFEIDNAGFLADNDSCIVFDRTVPYNYRECAYGETLNYLLCIEDVQLTRCPPAYFQCVNMECVADIFVCDLKQDCVTGEDEHNCDNICSASFAVDVNYCRNICHRTNCSCSDVLYQCFSGGCLHNSKVCDGYINCDDGTDESMCHTHMGQSQSVLHSTKVLKDTTQNLCGTFSIPCTKGDSQCYSLNNTCLYDTDANGHLKYCINAQHLQQCETMECSGSYKCETSYCIPTHRVCNGVIDCPYADDESKCPLVECANMLKCQIGQYTACVHPQQICDGNKDCNNGEDELLCRAPPCPANCLCEGYFVSCNRLNLQSIPPNLQMAKALYIKHNQLQLSKSALNNFQRLLILDLQHNDLTLFPMIRKQCSMQTLFRLDLSHNSFEFIKSHQFVCLENLRELSISHNPVESIYNFAFTALSRLMWLNLHHTSLATMSPDLFQPFENLDVLNISHSKLRSLWSTPCKEKLNLGMLDLSMNILLSISESDLTCLEHISEIVTDNSRFCCLESLSGNFHYSSCITQECNTLLPGRGFMIFLTVIISITGTGNVLVVAYALLVKCRDYQYFFNLAIANIMTLEPMLVAIIWNNVYGAELNFYEETLQKSILCRLTSFLTQVSTQASISFVLAIAISKYLGITRVHFSKSGSSKNWFIMATVTWIIWGIMALSSQSLGREKRRGTHSCFISQQQAVYGDFNFFRAVFNVCVCVVVLILYGRAVHITWMANIKQGKLGRSHGRNIYSSVIIRLIVMIVTIAAVSFPPNILLMVTLTSTYKFQLAPFLLFSYLEAVVNPFLYTFSTKAFRCHINEVLPLSTRQCFKT